MAPPRKLLLAAILLIILQTSANPVHADNIEMYFTKVTDALKGTAMRTFNLQQEFTMAQNAYNAFAKEQKPGAPGIGQDMLNEQFPVALLNPSSIDQLTFQFIDPATLLPTAGPSTASVLYASSQTPDDPASFTPIGTSTNALTNFAFPFLAPAVEEAIEAIPMDALGAPIFISGVDGLNVAPGLVTYLPAVPEPSTLFMLGGGLLVLLAAAGRTRLQV